MINQIYITAKGMPAHAAAGQRAPMPISVGVSALACSKREAFALSANVTRGSAGNAVGLGFSNPRYRQDNSLEKARIKLR